MSRSGTRAREILDDWREQHADHLDPLRFHFIEALETRAASHGGEARRILDDRLSNLIEAYAADLERAASRTGNAGSTTAPRAPAGETLGGLINHIASCDATVSGDDLSEGDAVARRPRFPELAVLEEFRKTWSRVRTESQLRQSLEQAPANAGPLNSGALVHRSIALMRELSPGYLQQFLSYVDDLSWIKQMNDGGVMATEDAPRAGSTRKRARDKSRGRRE